MANVKYVRKLGNGSFGEVWLVEDLGTGALRAVKFVARSAIPDLKSYNEEARVLDELQHPNIVKVYGTEVFSDDDPGPGAGMYGIIMEYMPGGSLEDALDDGPLSLRTAISHVRDACRGADLAHGKGYVHRDIKPANILLSDQHTKLSDFGLCAATGGGIASAAGTLIYVAPEVISTGATSIRSDVYSAGVTLYELVNGTPFVEWDGDGEDLENAILRGMFPDRSAYLPFVPDSLRKVIGKATHVNAEKRYASIEDLRIALQRVPINCAWRLESAGSGPEVWIGLADHGVFKATLSVTGGSFELSRCKELPGPMRRVKADCIYGATAPQLRKHQRAVMQRIVERGR